MLRLSDFTNGLVSKSNARLWHITGRPNVAAAFAPAEIPHCRERAGPVDAWKMKLLLS